MATILKTCQGQKFGDAHGVQAITACRTEKGLHTPVSISKEGYAAQGNIRNWGVQGVSSNVWTPDYGHVSR